MNPFAVTTVLLQCYDSVNMLSCYDRQTPYSVTTVLLQCYYTVTTVFLAGHYRVTPVLCYYRLTVVLQQCCSVTVLLHLTAGFQCAGGLDAMHFGGG